MFLDEEWPVSTARGRRSPKVPEVPRQDERPSGLGHPHDHGVSQIDTRRLESLQELQSATMLDVRGSIENVRTVQQRVAEDQCGARVAASAQHEVNLHVDRPGDDDPPTEHRE
jgi:hypothetical protein